MALSPLAALPALGGLLDWKVDIERNPGAMGDQEIDDRRVLAADSRPERTAASIAVRGIDIGAAPDQFANNLDMAVETGTAQGQAGGAMNIRLFEVGFVLKGGQYRLKVALFDGLEKRTGHDVDADGAAPADRLGRDRNELRKLRREFPARP